MANHKIITNTDGSSVITIHGRGSLPFVFDFRDEDTRELIDISARPIRLEVDGVPITILGVPDASYPKCLVFNLTRTHVSMLETKPTRFAFIDETFLDQDMPFPLHEGTIGRTGYVNAPDAVDDL